MTHKHYKVPTTYYNMLSADVINKQWRILNKAETEYLVCVQVDVDGPIDTQYEITKEQFDYYLQSSDWK